MSTHNDNSSQQRPTQDEAHERKTLLEIIKTSPRSIKPAILLTGVGSLIIGLLVWIFLRGIETPAFIVMGLGAVILLIYGIISLSEVRGVFFGRRGRYGLNTTIIFVVALTIAIIGNITVYLTITRTNPPNWMRIDTTATKQFLLEERVVNILNNMKEPIHITAFFTEDTTQDIAASRFTEDLLNELKRRSTTHDLTYEIIDPEINPNAAKDYRVNRFPALAIEGIDSRRTEVVFGLNPSDTNQVFTEQDIATGLIIVNQIAQKKIIFITGHSERDVTDGTGADGFGLAGKALQRENYIILNETLQELGIRLRLDDPTEIPAVIVIPEPSQDLLPIEENILLEYARIGGSIIITIEPNNTSDTIKGLLSRYGVAIGEGEAADIASFVAPNPTFLQVKKSNGQLPPHPITSDFEVLYLPGSTHFAWSIDPETIPLHNGTIPIIQQYFLASTTLNSWSEEDTEVLNFDVEQEQAGPLPVAILVTAISELSGVVDSQKSESPPETNIVLIGDTDFASNQYFGSANNADLFVNSVNWLARDFELISIRSKTSATRQLFLTKNELDFIRWSGWLLMPALISTFGFWHWWRRR